MSGALQSAATLSEVAPCSLRIFWVAALHMEFHCHKHAFAREGFLHLEECPKLSLRTLGTDCALACTRWGVKYDFGKSARLLRILVRRW